MGLAPAQTNALMHVRGRAEAARAGARERLAEVLSRAGEQPSAVDVLAARLRDHATVTLNFHPDRLLAGGRTVAQALLEEGRYRSQFETGVTSGSRTAFAGGERDGWEEKLFGGAYQQPGVRLEERPKYGALNLMEHADGGSPRFGSCYIELRPHMTRRCTLTWGDSHEGPEHVATSDVLEPVLAALIESAHAKGEALGVSGIDVGSLLRSLSAVERGAGARARDPARGVRGRALDAYIEAQVHADITMSADVEALVVDPSFEGTSTGESLRELCSLHGIRFAMHPGFVLAAEEVPDDFRGPRMVPLAERVSRRFSAGGLLDAAAIGRAAQSLHREPDTWNDWGTLEESLQHIKQLWHVLVQFGR